MATKLPRKDVAIIGLGWTGAILAHELTDQGLDVVAIERGPWRDTATDFNIGYAADEIVAYLKNGANRDAVASDGMAEEVVHSSSAMTDDDLRAIAVYLLSLKPPAESNPAPIAAADARMRAGQAIYKDSCAGCHTEAGNGVPQLFPVSPAAVITYIRNAWGNAAAAVSASEVKQIRSRP
jgi:mono/diheme cytochrome c family protein